MSFLKKIVITGGAGFIGSHLLNWMCNQYPDYQIINLDGLTYAANLDNVAISSKKDNYQFLHIDINNREEVFKAFRMMEATHVIHLAAESHVDNSIEASGIFMQTNIIGTQNLLDASKEMYSSGKFEFFYHISTDEVFGSLGKEGHFSESSPYQPNNPYSVSKASSDFLVRAYGNTYKLPYLISNCSNNYGPHQYEEKLIPVIIKQIINKQPIPIYGKGDNKRDWLFVKDHVQAIDKIFHSNLKNESFCIGGGMEISNLELANMICQIMDKEFNTESSHKLITFVEDRKGHDFRYSIDSSKIHTKLGWKATTEFKEGLLETIQYYISKF